MTFFLIININLIVRIWINVYKQRLKLPQVLTLRLRMSRCVSVHHKIYRKTSLLVNLFTITGLTHKLCPRTIFT